MNYKLSVIIPVYNVENTIYRSLKSVCDQTYTNLEIILVNDGSSDGSGNICMVMAANDARIICINKENEGVSSARNVGLECATGEYITFFDPDDVLMPNTYEILMKEILDMSADIAIGGFVRVLNERKIYVLQKTNKCVFDSNTAIRTMLKAKIFRSEVCDKIYKKEIVKDATFCVEISHAEDLLFNFNVFQKTNRIVFYPTYGYQYYVNSTSETNNFSLSTLTYIKALRKMLRTPHVDVGIMELLYGRYAIALASCIFKMILSHNLLYEPYIRKYRRMLKKIGIKAFWKSGLSLRQKCGVIYVLLPLYICKILTFLAIKFQKNL